MVKIANVGIGEMNLERYFFFSEEFAHHFKWTMF